MFRDRYLEYKCALGIIGELVSMGFGIPDLKVSYSIVTPYKCLGKISDILHLNNENNQLERQAWPPKDVPLNAQSWT